MDARMKANLMPMMAGAKVAGDDPRPASGEGGGAATLHATLLPQIALAQATELARVGQYATALDLLNGSPEAGMSPAGLDLRARMCAQQGRLAEAEALWLEARRLDPQNSAYAVGLAEIARRQRGAALRLPWRPLVGLALLLAVVWLWIGKAARPDVLNVGAAITTTTANQAAAAVAFTPAALPSTGEVTPPPALPLAAVRAALQADPLVGQWHVLVWQEGPVVYLGGVAPQLAVKARAEQVARETPGVGPVDSGGLVVDPAPLLATIRAALATNPMTAGLDVAVESDGVGIALSGVLSVEAERAQILEVVRAVTGVGLVDDSRLAVVVPSMAPELTFYTVQGGDNLATIALRFYGDAARWPLVFAANRDQLRDPDRIEAGMVLVIPPSSN